MPVLILRCSATLLLLLAGVFEADPVKDVSSRASAKRDRSLPTSANTRAPAWFPAPGKLVMILAPGVACDGRSSASVASDSAPTPHVMSDRASGLIGDISGVVLARRARRQAAVGVDRYPDGPSGAIASLGQQRKRPRAITRPSSPTTAAS